MSIRVSSLFSHLHLGSHKANIPSKIIPFLGSPFPKPKFLFHHRKINTGKSTKKAQTGHTGLCSEGQKVNNMKLNKHKTLQRMGRKYHISQARFSSSKWRRLHWIIVLFSPSSKQINFHFLRFVGQH